MTVAVGSKNPCKVAAVTVAFSSILASASASPPTLSVTGLSASSGVPDQPMGDGETLLGAKNRAEGAASIFAASNGGRMPDFSIGLEGGIVEEHGEMWCMAWMACCCPSEPSPARRFGIAQTGKFPLPPLMAALVRAGEELGVADDIVTKRVDSKRGGGTVGVLTNEIIPRGGYYEVRKGGVGGGSKGRGSAGESLFEREEKVMERRKEREKDGAHRGESPRWR